jgi:hypothetical protein
MTRLSIPAVAAGFLAMLACADSPKGSAQEQPRATADRKAYAPVDACTLLTQAEAEAITGKSIGAPTKGGSGECHYGEEGSSHEIIVYPMMLGFDSKEAFHAFVVKDTEEMNARMKEGLKGTGATVKETAVEPVSQVGDAAYYVEPSLVVLSQGRVLNIVAADRKQAVAVAAKVLPRFEVQ